MGGIVCCYNIRPAGESTSSLQRISSSAASLLRISNVWPPCEEHVDVSERSLEDAIAATNVRPACAKNAATNVMCS